MKEDFVSYIPSHSATVLASVSGGKDSTALMLYLREIGVPFRAYFFDTGWEHADTYAHIDYLERSLSIPIQRRGAHIELAPEVVPIAVRIEQMMGRSTPSAFVRMCLKKRIFPRRTVRFCTQELKVLQARNVIRESHEAGELPVNAVGIRAAESAARAKLAETELSGALDVLIWRPLIRWTEADVLAIHRRHGVKLNPLYLRGAERVGCWPCIMASKQEIRMIGRDRDRIQAIRELEAAVRTIHEASIRERGEEPLRPPTLFTAVRREADGSRPNVLIDEAVRWSRTARGQSLDTVDMTAGDDVDELSSGCMRWGMCEQNG